MSTPLAKRRKLDSAAALAKPFKSPFRRPAPTESAASNSPSASTKPTTAPISTSTSSSFVVPSRKVTQSRQESSESPAPPKPTISSNAHASAASLSSSSVTSTIDPQSISDLQKQHTRLLNALKSVKGSLDTADQALRIETSDKDAELLRLIEIWRKASQSAAEEVYSGVRDRVNGMGGLQAWRQREKDKFGGNAETAWGWDENERKRNDDECEDEADDHEDEESKEEEEQEEEEGFTMDMMLKSLNIELGLIGYDKEAQRWKE